PTAAAGGEAPAAEAVELAGGGAPACPEPAAPRPAPPDQGRTRSRTDGPILRRPLQRTHQRRPHDRPALAKGLAEPCLWRQPADNHQLVQRAGARPDPPGLRRRPPARRETRRLRILAIAKRLLAGRARRNLSRLRPDSQGCWSESRPDRLQGAAQ